MFGYYPQRQSYPYFYNNDYDDYLRAFAAQRAREREEARYRTQIQDAARSRRAYQEQLARARAQAEAERRRSMYDPFFGYEDHYEPYSSFVQPQLQSSYRRPSYIQPGDDEDYNSYGDPARGRQAYLENLMQQKMTEKESETQVRMNVHSAPSSPKRKQSPVQEPAEPSQQRNRPLSSLPRTHARKAAQSTKATASPKPSPSPEPQAPSSKINIQIYNPVEDQAAHKIQGFVRSHLPRRKALKAVSSMASEFESILSSFMFPETLDFDEATSDFAKLLYTPRNVSLHAHEEALMKLLSKLDAVDSRGDGGIRMARKKLVKRIEKRLAEIDEKKTEMWKAQKESGNVPTEKEDTSEREDTMEMADDERQTTEPQPEPEVAPLMTADPDEKLEPLSFSFPIQDASMPPPEEQQPAGRNRSSSQSSVSKIAHNLMGQCMGSTATDALQSDYTSQLPGEVEMDTTPFSSDSPLSASPVAEVIKEDESNSSSSFPTPNDVPVPAVSEEEDAEDAKMVDTELGSRMSIDPEEITLRLKQGIPNVFEIKDDRKV